MKAKQPFAMVRLIGQKSKKDGLRSRRYKKPRFHDNRQKKELPYNSTNTSEKKLRQLSAHATRCNEISKSTWTAEFLDNATIMFFCTFFTNTMRKFRL